MSADAIRLDAADQVATALHPLAAGDDVAVLGPGAPQTLVAREAIPAFHKLALSDLPAGTRVRKYGAVIGQATAAIAAGGLVHVHNLDSLKARPSPLGRRAKARDKGGVT